MAVSVTLHSALKKKDGSGEPCRMPYRDGLTVSQVLAAVDVQQNVVGVVLVNGHLITDMEYELSDESSVELYPLFAGG